MSQVHQSWYGVTPFPCRRTEGNAKRLSNATRCGIRRTTDSVYCDVGMTSTLGTRGKPPLFVHLRPRGNGVTNIRIRVGFEYSDFFRFCFVIFFLKKKKSFHFHYPRNQSQAPKQFPRVNWTWIFEITEKRTSPGFRTNHSDKMSWHSIASTSTNRPLRRAMVLSRGFNFFWKFFF